MMVISCNQPSDVSTLWRILASFYHVSAHVCLENVHLDGGTCWQAYHKYRDSPQLANLLEQPSHEIQTSFQFVAGNPASIRLAAKLLPHRSSGKACDGSTSYTDRNIPAPWYAQALDSCSAKGCTAFGLSFILSFVTSAC